MENMVKTALYEHRKKLIEAVDQTIEEVLSTGDFVDQTFVGNLLLYNTKMFNDKSWRMTPQEKEDLSTLVVEQLSQQ